MSKSLTHARIEAWAMVSPKLAATLFAMVTILPAALLVMQVVQPEFKWHILGGALVLAGLLILFTAKMFDSMWGWVQCDTLERLRDAMWPWEGVTKTLDPERCERGEWTERWLRSCLFKLLEDATDRVSFYGNSYLVDVGQIVNRDLHRMAVWLEQDYADAMTKSKWFNNGTERAEPQMLATDNGCSEAPRPTPEGPVWTGELIGNLRASWRENYGPLEYFLAMCIRHLSRGEHLEFNYLQMDEGGECVQDRLESIILKDSNGNYPKLLWSHEPFGEDEPKKMEVEDFGPFSRRVEQVEPPFDLREELRGIAADLKQLLPKPVSVSVNIDQADDHGTFRNRQGSDLDLTKRNFLVMLDDGRFTAGQVLSDEELMGRPLKLWAWGGIIVEVYPRRILHNDVLPWVEGLREALAESFEATERMHDSFTLLEVVTGMPTERLLLRVLDPDRDPEMLASRK